MRTLVLFGLSCLFSIFACAQIQFEPGHVITNDGQKVVCYIKNVDWKNNPDKFEYRITPEGETKMGSIDTHREFGFESGTKYIGREIQINRSSNKTAELEDSRAITFQQEKLFLKVIADGDAKLYYYEDGDLRRFFFSMDNGQIVQLRYKRFRKDPEFDKYQKKDNQIGENNEFRQQLWNALNCEGQNKTVIKKLAYKIDPLTKLFNEYNSCVNPNYAMHNDNVNGFDFQLNIRAGISSNTLLVTRSLSQSEFRGKIGYILGVEFEGIMPFNKNKWSLFFQPTFQLYKNESEWVQIRGGGTNPRRATVEYNSLEVPLGFRHYVFLENNSKLFFNTGYVIVLPLDSGMYLNDTKIEFGSTGNFFFGLGFGSRRMAIEARYNMNREVFDNTIVNSYESNYKGFSLILGYTIF